MSRQLPLKDEIFLNPFIARERVDGFVRCAIKLAKNLITQK